MPIRIRHLSRAAFETIQRAARAFAAPVENVSTDHRGFDILVAQEFLYGSDIITVIHQGITQENTDYDVAASELSYPLRSIIDAVTVCSKEEKGGISNSEIKTTGIAGGMRKAPKRGHWVNQTSTCLDLHRHVLPVPRCSDECSPHRVLSY